MSKTRLWVLLCIIGTSVIINIALFVNMSHNQEKKDYKTIEFCTDKWYHREKTYKNNEYRITCDWSNVIWTWTINWELLREEIARRCKPYYDFIGYNTVEESREIWIRDFDCSQLFLDAW